MSWGAVRLKSTYRDQLIRELQHLAWRKNVTYSQDVHDIMDAIRREHARDVSESREKAKVQASAASKDELEDKLRRKGYSPLLAMLWRKRTLRHDDILEASELYFLEASLIEYLETQDLKLRIAGFRDMLANLLTADSYNAIAGQLCDLATEADEEKLRGEARALASRLYRRYEGVPAVERLRRNIVGSIGVAATLTVGLVLVAVVALQAPVAWVAAAGAIGASVSTIARLYDLDARHEPFRMWLTIENGQMTLIMAPLVGATFALVLLAMFWGGVVSGIVFPHFDAAPTVTSKLGLSPGSFAKLMLWGFASGWAERMVPDVLNKLSPQAGESLVTPSVTGKRRQ